MDGIFDDYESRDRGRVTEKSRQLPCGVATKERGHRAGKSDLRRGSMTLEAVEWFGGGGGDTEDPDSTRIRDL